jgi:hypothetical protein
LIGKMNRRNFIRLICLILFSMIIIMLNSCDVFKTPVSNENPDDNPLDPTNPDYQPPLATITQGPADGSTINNDYVTFSWSGNSPECQFSYTLDDAEPSAWSSGKTVTFDYLDEGDHSFQVKARYSVDDVQEDPSTVSFMVDAIAGPALWICHKKTTTSVSSDFAVDVIVEEVTDLSMASVVVNFAPAYLQIRAYEVLEDESILSGKQLIKVNSHDDETGKLTVYLALVDGSNAVLSGTGSIIRVHFLSLKRGTTEIGFGEDCYFRKSDNSAIPIVYKAISLVEIE